MLSAFIVSVIIKLWKRKTKNQQ